MSLKAQIDAFNVQKEANLPADVLALMNTTNEELIAQHIRNNALQVGDKIENFILPNHLGKNIELADLLDKGWLDDLFPKAKFLDALNMVEKAGHKKQVMVARNEYINEGKPKNTTADSEGDDPFGGGDSVSRLTDQTTTQSLEGERPKAPEQGRDMPDDDDLYGATPRPSRPIVPIRNDVPEDDDLEALIAEAEGQYKSHKERLARAEPDEDDLDALMAEAEGQDRTKVSEPDRLATGDEDLDALMAEAETQDQTAELDRHETRKEGKSANAYEDEEAAMQEMEGLW